MTRKHWLTAGTALALGLAWTAGPALAQQTTGEKIDKKVEQAEDKAERAKAKADAKAEEAKAKAERTKDKAEVKAEETKAKADAKVEKAKDKAEAKTESTMDHAKDKARDMKDKAKDKTSELTDAAKTKTAEMKHKMDRANAAHDRQEVMAMQHSLREKGFDPGPEDGVIGPRTHAALLDYQKKENLTPTGRWDDDTKSRLGVTAMTAPDKTAVSASPADPRGEKTTVNTPPPTKRNAP